MNVRVHESRQDYPISQIYPLVASSDKIAYCGYLPVLDTDGGALELPINEESALYN
jgi:hypothetical protein